MQIVIDSLISALAFTGFLLALPAGYILYRLGAGLAEDITERRYGKK